MIEREMENDCEVFDERKGMNEFEMATSFC
jgi:hypothetical protein